jgi:hypothetical protein
MEGDEQPPQVVPVVQPANELIAPVVDHAEKITRIEEKQAQHEQELFRQLSELESRLSNASKEDAERLYTRINELETKLEAMATKPAEELDEAVDFEVPPIEESPAPPEDMPRGRRAKRKARRKAK